MNKKEWLTLKLFIKEEKNKMHYKWHLSWPNINKTDRHDMAEILLKVALNTIKQTNKHN